jgi:arylsulfatase A-like enzyme
VLVLMCDQLQAQVFAPGHPCRTPHLDRYFASGLRVAGAYTPNAICSPARASLMTGLLPHGHNMLTVHHCHPPDFTRLRRDKPHWAQHLAAAGYRTGYFGKWHVDHDERPGDFGWQVDGNYHSPLGRQHPHRGARPEEFTLAHPADSPPGYRSHVFYGAHTVPLAERAMGGVTSMAGDFLTEVLARPEQPWCCFVSTSEPHDPFHTHADTLATYDIDALPLPASWRDPLTDRPGLYRKLARQWAGYTEREAREAMACYYGSITELDQCFGRLLAQLEASGQAEQTIVLLTSDHGEHLGAHGLYCKNVGAFEEVYQVPLLVRGPGIAAGQTVRARVGLHDLAPTLTELCGVAPLETAGHSRSAAALLREPAAHAADWQRGFAEYNGARYLLTQRVYWDGPWKLVHNGFDEDELYHLEEDPHELRNRIADPACAAVVRRLFGQLWELLAATGDASLLNTHYPAIRLAPYGPLTR